MHFFFCEIDGRIGWFEPAHLPAGWQESYLSRSGTTVLLPCLVMLQRVSRSYKGHQISKKFDTNEEVK